MAFLDYSSADPLRLLIQIANLAFQEVDTSLYSHQQSIEETCFPETSLIVVVVYKFISLNLTQSNSKNFCFEFLRLLRRLSIFHGY